MFTLDRVFTQRNSGTGCMEWFFDSREGLIGPFRTESAARHYLGEHIKHCRNNHLDGGRKLGLKITHLSVAAN
jgi:hypothetical protein